MSDEAENTAPATPPKRRQGRSPAYPFIALKSALDQARALYDAEGRYSAPLPPAFAAWGYGAKSSGGRQTVAALRYFGLIDVEGEGDNRKVKVSDDALRALLDEREDRSEYHRLIRDFALKPAVHQRLIEQYPKGLPSDASVRHFLMFECEFNESAAIEVLDEFKETAAFAKLYQPNNMQDKSEGETPTPDGGEKIVVGHFVQWEQGGDLQLAEPWKVARIETDPDTGKKYLWCEGQNAFEGKTGYIPMEEAIVQERPAQSSGQRFAPPPKTTGHDDTDKLPAPGYRKAVFNLDEGDVTIMYPEGMSQNGCKDLDDYLRVFMRKAKRAAGIKDDDKTKDKPAE